MNKEEKEIIDAYFNDPRVKELLNQELGTNGKIHVDWENRTITAQGNKAHKIWNMDEFIHGLTYRNKLS